MSQVKIYAGNLAYSVTEDALQDYFAKFGEITEAKLITDRETGRSKGFGFITYATPESAKAAVDEANGQELEGRPLRVNPAKEDQRRGGGGRSGGGRPRHHGGGNGGNHW